MEPINSFVSMAEKITILNKNCVEILTKINDLVESTDSSVKIVYDDNGVVRSYSMPTVGNLKTQIDTLNQNIKRLASIDGYTYLRDGKSYKRILTSDLNREPMPVSNINSVSTFSPINNHFFESLMNPMLAVSIDLTDKVATDVNKILSRRYILRFLRNDDGSLTESGLRSYNSFISTYLNRTDINITDFLAWYNNPSNDGMFLDTVEPYDEQIYDLKLKNLNYYGVFSVIKVEMDDINNKMWYHVNDIKYYGQDGTIKSLVIGDELILNKLNSSSRYRVVEVNTDSSNTKIRLEVVEGYDPVVIGTNVLKYYSDISSEKKVQINVGFDEYTIIFIKPINTDDNIVSNIWSKGICFYTNDLLLDTNNNINLANYYVEQVYDYGTLLRDMIKKIIPSSYGYPPNPPVLTQDNFKVVQINKHLTDSVDQDSLKKIHSEKSTIKTRISQLNTAITSKTSKLYSGGLTSTEKQSLTDEITKLRSDLDVASKSLSSSLSQINEINSNVNNNVEPKYRVRGFWSIPEPILTDKSVPQHVIQFRIEYRYASKTGNSNNTETFNYTVTSTPAVSNTTTINPMPYPFRKIEKSTENQAGASVAITSSQSAASTASVFTGKSTPVTATNISTTTENPTTTPKYANFSNWVSILTDVRKRHWDATTKQWYWMVEDVSDADTVNINQLDIPIQPDEKIEIRIKSISEVGWPDSLIESDWSDVLSIEFPDDLKDTFSDKDFITKEADQDNTFVNIDNTLNSKGLYKHIENSFYSNQDYIAHIDTNIQVSFKNSSNVNQTLYEYLTILTNKITKLEEIIAGVKGNIKISLLKKSTLVKDITNNSTTTVTVECEDYGIATTGTRVYLNNKYIVDDYVLSIQNIAQSGNLGFLSLRNYTGTTTNYYTVDGGDLHKIFMVDSDSTLWTQKNNQFLWFADKDGGSFISSGFTNASQTFGILSSSNLNIGSSGSTNGISVSDGLVWEDDSVDAFLTSVFPYLPDLNILVETGQDKTKILSPQSKFNIGLRIYFKYSSTSDSTFTPSISTNKSYTRKIKTYMELSDNSVFQFTIIFKMNRFRNFLKVNSGASTISIGGGDTDVLT